MFLGIGNACSPVAAYSGIVLALPSKVLGVDFPKDDSAAAKATQNDGDAIPWYKAGKGRSESIPKNANVHTEEESCIAVIGPDTFCNKKKLGHSHSRCFTHAKCLIRDGGKSIGYSPDLCSVCMEYLDNCHSSLRCCERIFRIFKFFRGRLGLSFDWENKFLKDLFFDNYRKLQAGAPSNPGERLTVSYTDFRAQEKLNDIKSKEIHASLGMEGEPVPSKGPGKSDLRSVLDQMRNDTGSTPSNPVVEGIGFIPPDNALCSFLSKYLEVERGVTESNKQPSYYITLGKDDPFVTEVCKNIKSFQNNYMPSPSLLCGIHAQFTCKNDDYRQVSNFLQKPIELSDISFQVGEQKAHCNQKILEKFNFTIGLTKYHFNCYAAVKALGFAIAKFSLDNALSPEVSEFLKSMMESMYCLGKEVLDPLKYYFQLAILDKQNLRRSGFKMHPKDNTVATLIRYNILCKGLFDQAALQQAAKNSKTLASLVNAEDCKESSG